VTHVSGHVGVRDNASERQILAVAARALVHGAAYKPHDGSGKPSQFDPTLPVAAALLTQVSLDNTDADNVELAVTCVDMVHGLVKAVLARKTTAEWEAPDDTMLSTMAWAVEQWWTRHHGTHLPAQWKGRAAAANTGLRELLKQVERPGPTRLSALLSEALDSLDVAMGNPDFIALSDMGEDTIAELQRLFMPTGQYTATDVAWYRSCVLLATYAVAPRRP
jgi:hypothetical protein